MEKYINALANDTAEIQDILEKETKKIHRRHISHPDFIPTRIPIFEESRICSLIEDLIPSENYLDEYTTIVYWNLTVLASHVHVVSSLGNVGPDMNIAYIKFSHALCKLKELRAVLGFNRSLYNLCRYNETITLFSRTEKVDYSISVMKYGIDSLRTILSTIREVALGETPRSFVCP
ncbi:hypothetical protein ACJMK2_005125 [Sinanodonta woodiana]|uniref:Uncharacterized protein n=1 Tax=Sinanodonta woodiana TaxID=1069815 RepID=A0ABD3VPE9_SINWO